MGRVSGRACTRSSSIQSSSTYHGRLRSMSGVGSGYLGSSKLGISNTGAGAGAKLGSSWEMAIAPSPSGQLFTATGEGGIADSPLGEPVGAKRGLGKVERGTALALG